MIESSSPVTVPARTYDKLQIVDLRVAAIDPNQSPLLEVRFRKFAVNEDGQRELCPIEEPLHLTADLYQEVAAIDGAETILEQAMGLLVQIARAKGVNV